MTPESTPPLGGDTPAPPLVQDYTGVWLNRTKPYLAYRVLPKCGCTSIGQIMHHIDAGSLYSNDIHAHDAPILRWEVESAREKMSPILAADQALWFTLVRNPYKRLLSAFADKIYGYQDDGRRYSDGMIHRHLQGYGLHWGPKSNLIDNFKIFVRFTADTVQKNKPMWADVHWIPCFKQLAFTARMNPSWKLDFIGHIESLREDMASVVRLAGIPGEKVPPSIPRENTTSLPDIPISEFYGPEEIEIMTRVYGNDYRVFGYSQDPEDTKPRGKIDVVQVNAELDRIRKGS